MLPASAGTALAVSPDLVISQVYGAGGNTGALFQNDYVELYNRSVSAVDLDAYSIQYASATGTGNFGATAGQLTELPAYVLNPGAYILIVESGGLNGSPLPNPNITDGTPIAMAAGAGKVAIVSGDASLGCNGSTTPCPNAAKARIVDLVGYGTGTSGATFFEGSGPAPTISITLADFRAGNGATDTDDNAADFTSATPNPRTTGADAAPTVASTSPAAGAQAPIDTNVSITFSEAVTVTGAWFSIACSLSGDHTATASGGPTTFTLDPDADFVDGDACTVTVLAAQVKDVDGNDPPDNMTSNFVVTFDAFNVCDQSFTPIPSIQGSGPNAAITGTVTTEGIVVGDFEGTTAVGLQGFYLQDETGDGEPATSDGIFVFTGDTDNHVATGDRVRVTGYARERFNQTSINGSNSNTAPTTTIVPCGVGPTIDPVDVSLPFATSDFPERFEGMLVRLPQALVISEYFNYDRFGELVLAEPLDGEDRPFTPTLLEEPGAAAQARAAANLLSRITLDDGLGTQNPPSLRHPNGDPFSLTNRFRGGDTVTNTTGILGYDFGVYRIQPTADAGYAAENDRPAAPDPVGGTLRVGAMNALNFFLTLDTTASDSGPGPCGANQNLDCRGADADQPDEFTRQRDKLVAEIAGLDADVIAFSELENTPGVEPLSDPTDGLVAGANAIPGVGPYAAIDTGVIGTDAIRVGLIYRTDKVEPVGAFKILDHTVDPRFVDTKSRPVLAQSFRQLSNGAIFTVAANHLKSKGSACVDLGDPDTGDGQGNCNLTRTAAAQALVDWLATDPTGSGDRDYLIVGDLNSYAMEDPISAIRAGADDSAGTADDYTNLISTYQGPFAHSYVFDGQAGYLDHALASPTLTGQVTGAADWHINSDEPDILDYDTSFKPPAQDALYEPNAYRASDHDPIVVGLDLQNFGFNGFQAPVDNPPILNTVKASQGVPVMFQLSGNLGLDVLFGTPTANQFTCDLGAGTDAVEATTTGGSGLQYDPATNTYTYVWKTQKTWVNQCRSFELTFDDGAYRNARFEFLK
jgi:hypothetical protein